MSQITIPSSPNINNVINTGLNLATADASSDYIINFNFPPKIFELQVEWSGVSSSNAKVHVYDRNHSVMSFQEYSDASILMNSAVGNQKILLWQFAGSDIKITVEKGDASVGTVKLAYGARS